MQGVSKTSLQNFDCPEWLQEKSQLEVYVSTLIQQENEHLR